MNALRLKRFKAHPAHAAAEQGAPLSPMPAQPRAERLELQMCIRDSCPPLWKKRKFVCVDTNDIPEVAVIAPDMICLLYTSELGAPDYEKALEQHRAYIETLRQLSLIHISVCFS